MEIKISEMPDGRFEAQYINPADTFIHGISQFGKTAFEAEINLQALLNAVKKQQFRTNICINL